MKTSYKKSIGTTPRERFHRALQKRVFSYGTDRNSKRILELDLQNLGDLTKLVYGRISV